MIDVHHFHRAGDDVKELEKVPAEWFRFGHICDAPAEILRQAGDDPGSAGRALLRGEGASMALHPNAMPLVPYSIELPNLKRWRSTATRSTPGGASDGQSLLRGACYWKKGMTSIKRPARQGGAFCRFNSQRLKARRNLTAIPAARAETIIIPREAAMPASQLPPQHYEGGDTGEVMARATVATTSWEGESPRDASIPMATSLRRIPSRMGAAASAGSPSRPENTGASSLDRKAVTPMASSAPTKSMPKRTSGTASMKNPLTRIHSFSPMAEREGVLYGGISTISSGLNPGRTA